MKSVLDSFFTGAILFVGLAMCLFWIGALVSLLLL